MHTKSMEFIGGCQVAKDQEEDHQWYEWIVLKKPQKIGCLQVQENIWKTKNDTGRRHRTVAGISSENYLVAIFQRLQNSPPFHPLCSTLTHVAASYPRCAYIGRLHFLTCTFAETFAEPKLRSKYLPKSKSEVISLSENMAINTDSLVN